MSLLLSRDKYRSVEVVQGEPLVERMNIRIFGKTISYSEIKPRI